MLQSQLADHVPSVQRNVNMSLVCVAAFVFDILFYAGIRKSPDAVRRVGRPRIVCTKTIVPTIERLLNRPRTQIHHLAQNRQHWYEETERLCSLLRRELQADV